MYLAVRRPEHRLDASRPTRVSGRLVVPIDPERFAAGVPGKRAEIHNLAVGFSEEGAQGSRAVRGAHDGAQFVDTETRAPIGSGNVVDTRQQPGARPLERAMPAATCRRPPDDLLRRVQAANDEGLALVEGAEIYDLIHLSGGKARRDEAQETDQEQHAGEAFHEVSFTQPTQNS